MMRHKLQSELWVPKPLDEVWSFAQNPENLLTLTPPHYGLSLEQEGESLEGRRVKLQLAPWGLPLPLKWVSVIEKVREQGSSREFTDTQESGPFAFWQHRHLFQEGLSQMQISGEERPHKNMTPGTWIRDFVEYELPLETLGAWAHQLFARKNLESLFAYRHRKMTEIFNS